MNPLAAIRPVATRRLTVTQRLAARKTLCTSIARCSNGSKSMPRMREEPEPQELGVGELQGAKFRIEPLRRVGETDDTKRARLIYQSRKRGTLESDLLLSTFAATYLPTMTGEQLTQFDLFLDENDWDIYYWATQHEPNSSTNPSVATSRASAGAVPADEATGGESEQGIVTKRHPPKGEWAQTVGNFQPAYRPVPQRWKDSEVLQLLRAHVRSRSVDGDNGGGMAFMPPLQS